MFTKLKVVITCILLKTAYYNKLFIRMLILSQKPLKLQNNIITVNNIGYRNVWTNLSYNQYQATIYKLYLRDAEDNIWPLIISPAGTGITTGWYNFFKY